MRCVLPALAMTLVGCALLEPPAERGAPPDLELQGVTLDQYRHGHLDARARLRQVRYQRDAARAIVEGLEIQPMERGAPAGKLSAPDAEALLRRGTAHLTGGVAYDSVQRDRFETASCDVDLLRRSARGADPVRGRGPGYALEGTGFTSDLRHPGRIELGSPVKARFEAAPTPSIPAPARQSSRRAATRRSK